MYIFKTTSKAIYINLFIENIFFYYLILILLLLTNNTSLF